MVQNKNKKSASFTRLMLTDFFPVRPFPLHFCSYGMATGLIGVKWVSEWARTSFFEVDQVKWTFRSCSFFTEISITVLPLMVDWCPKLIADSISWSRGSNLLALFIHHHTDLVWLRGGDDAQRIEHFADKTPEISKEKVVKQSRIVGNTRNKAPLIRPTRRRWGQPSCNRNLPSGWDGKFETFTFYGFWQHVIFHAFKRYSHQPSGTFTLWEE